MDLTTNELVRRYSRKAFNSSLVMTLWAWPTAIVGSSQTLFPTLPFLLEWMTGHHLRRKGWGNRSLEQGQRGRPFELSFAKFTPFGIKGQWRQRLVFHAPQTSVLILALPSCHLYKRQTLVIIKILPRHKKCIIDNIRKITRYSKRNK